MRQKFNVGTIYLLCILWLIPCSHLLSQTKSNSNPNSILDLYTRSSSIKDSCTIVLLEMLDTMDITTHKDIVIFHKIVESLSTDITNVHVANYFLNNMHKMVPYPMENAEKMYEPLKEYPFWDALTRHSTWGLLKPLINFMSATRTKDDLDICVKIIELFTSGKVSQPILELFKYYGNNEMDKNLETIRIIQKN